MEMTETAKAATSSNTNATANAQALTAAQSGLSACQKRYPRKIKDAQARNECGKPYQATIDNLTATSPAKAVAFDAEAAGMLALWQAVADTYNGFFKDSTVDAGQVAFTVMLFIFTVFVLGKLFLWSKYAAWVAMYHGEPERLVTVDESSLGEPDAIHAQANASEPPTRKPFGFSPNSPAPSSAEINRAKYLHVSTLEPIQAHVNKHAHVKEHAHVNIQAHVNKHAHVSEPLQATDLYMQALNAKAGSFVECPQCGISFKKVNKQHTFCKPTCRDAWHNAQNPERVQYLKNRKRNTQ
jgi:hypothetical protein